MKNTILLILITLFFLTKESTSQIVYTDLEPDTTVNEFLNGYGLDFNDDDKIDVHITLLSNYGVWVMHLIPDSDVDNTYVLYDGEEASVLEEGDDISASSAWYKLGSGWGGLLYGYWESSGEYGNWTGLQEDKYLGIKFEIDGIFHYGWIKLTTHVFSYDDMEFTVQSYAYNSETNNAIAAGDTGIPSSIMEHNSQLFSVFPNPAQHHIRIQSEYDFQQITLVGTDGQIVLKQDNTSNTLDISRLRSGMYIVRIQTNREIFSTKLMITR